MVGKPWFEMYNPAVNWKTNEVKFKFQDKEIIWKCQAILADKNQFLVNSKVIRQLIKEDQKIRILLVRQLQYGDSNSCPNWNKLSAKIQAVLQTNIDIFNKKLPDKIPPNCEVDYHIELILGAQPVFRQPYRMSEAELAELKRQLDILLRAGYIRPFKSP